MKWESISEGSAAQHHWPSQNERGYRILERPYGTERPMRIIHVGAGISGICLSKYLDEASENVGLICYDKNADIGGTWFENKQVYQYDGRRQDTN